MARSVRVGARDIPMAVLAPVVAAIVVRLVFAYTDNTVSPDEAAYLGTGINIWRGHGITYAGAPELHFPPFLPIILGGLAKITPEPHHATVLVTFVASVALVLVVGALAARIGGRRAAILALWFAALSPGLSVIVARGAGGSEAIYAAIICGAALVTVGPRGTWRDPPSVLRGAVVGLLIGAGYLLRPEGILISVVFGLVLAVRARTVRRIVTVGAACLAGLAVLAAPYVAYLHRESGHWELTAKSVDVNVEAWHAVASQDRVTRDEYLYALDSSGHSTEHKEYALTALARAHPRQYLGIVTENLQQLYKSLLSPNVTTMPGWRVIALPLFPFALWALWRHRREPTVVAIGGVMALGLATVIGFFVLNRYLPPVVAVLVVLAAVGMAEIGDRRRRLWITLGIVTSLMSLATYFEGPHGPQIVREQPDLQIAARWLREHDIPRGARVMTRSTALTYYLPHNKLIVPAVGTPAQVLEFARFNRVRYFIFDPTTQFLRRQLAPLTRGHHAGFATVHKFRVDDRTTWIFKVLPARTEPLGRPTP